MNKISRVPPGLLCRAAAMAVMLSSGQFAWAADYTHEILSDNPIGYWQFEETSGLAIDSSPTGADGTYGAGVTPGLFPGAFSIGGKSAAFDGASFIDLPGSWGGPSMTEVTLEAWVNTAEDTGNFQSIIAGREPNGFAHFSLNSGGNSVVYTDSGVVALPIVPATPIDTWRYVVITAKPGESKVYVDGVQFGATVTTPYINVGESSTVDIGVGHLGGRFFSGLMDEVAIYDTALSAERVLAHFEAAGGTPPPPPPPPPPATGATLISHWTFDNDASDSVGVHDGTFEGGASITTDARVGGGALDLRTASGAEFGYVNVPTAAIDGESSVSVAMFVNIDDLAPGCCTALLANNGWSNAGAGAAGTLHFNLGGNAVPEFAINNNPGSAWGRDAAIPIDGSWVHLAFTYDKATGTTIPYVNGVAGTPGTGGVADIGLGPLWIGGWNGQNSRHPNGRIDDLRVYSGVLTPEEVANLAAVPEPSSILLLSLGLSGLGVFTRRRNRK